MTVVGIDLGTTNTVIAAVRDGRAAALKDKHGNALLPSVVSFSAMGDPKVGIEAKARRTIDPENTVFSIKRLIGRTFDSEPVKRAIPLYPFELKRGPGNSVKVSCYGKDYDLPEISAMVLTQAARIAEERLGSRVTDAVITVPANFNDLQRAATKVAGRNAGLDVLRIINEPTAAALAYGYGQNNAEKIAVYDFGGGTFDVTLLDLRGNVFEVLSTAGDTFLGGDDLDCAILDRMAEELLAKQKVDASKDTLVKEQLRAAAEELKIELSSRSMAKVKLEDPQFEFTMRRSEFEKLAEPLIARTLEVCQEAMDVAGMSKKDLDQVLLVGGSTRIPLVRRRISSFFGKMPQSRINPDEVVAMGAAIQAATLEEKQGQPNIMPAPRPKAGTRKASGTTQTGLAGLTQTLPGTSSTESPEARTSLLSGLKDLPKTASGIPTRTTSPPVSALNRPLSVGPLPGAAEIAKNNQTLSGVGASGGSQQQRAPTLRGMRAATGTTNMGLGTPSGAPPGYSPPGSTNASDQEQDPPSSTDGSVTFDLAELEAQEAAEANDFASLDEETTKVVNPSHADAHAAALDSIVDAEELGSGLELPRPDRQNEPEELSDSALFSLEEDDGHTDADLPVPSAGLPARVAAQGAHQADLPAPKADLPATTAGLPTVSRGRTDLPSPAAGLPDTHGAHELGLPLVGSGLPQPRTAPGSGLPAPRAAVAGQRVGSPRTQVGTPGLPAPSVDELDELSVSAPLPTEEESQATFNLREGPSFRPSTPDAAHSSGPAFDGPAFDSGDEGEATFDLPPRSSTRPPAATNRAPLLLDVTPLSLGVEVVGGYVDRLIERNSPVPCERTRTFATAQDNQQLVLVRVSQGEEGRFDANTVLGEVRLTGISPGPRGSVKVDVSFSLDENGMLQVSARDKATGNAANAQLQLAGVAP